MTQAPPGCPPRWPCPSCQQTTCADATRPTPQPSLSPQRDTSVEATRTASEPRPGAEAGMRASDSDRDRTSEVLRDAYAAGRLTLDEFLERDSAARAAQTWGQLCELTTDLPESYRPGPPQAEVYWETVEVRPHAGRPPTFPWAVALLWIAEAVADVLAVVPLMVRTVFLMMQTGRLTQTGRLMQTGRTSGWRRARRPGPPGGYPAG